jgi:hypothetical protein
MQLRTLEKQVLFGLKARIISNLHLTIEAALLQWVEDRQPAGVYVLEVS